MAEAVKAPVQQTVHPHVKAVIDHCKKEEMVGISVKTLSNGMEYGNFSNYMTVFSGEKGKAYAVSSMNSTDGKLKNGQIIDISDVNAPGVGYLGGSHGPSKDTLKSGKALSPEECKALWEEIGLKPTDVLKLTHTSLSFTHGPALREALESAGLDLTKEEMRTAVKEAHIYRAEAVDRIIDEMYA